MEPNILIVSGHDVDIPLVKMIVDHLNDKAVIVYTSDEKEALDEPPVRAFKIKPYDLQQLEIKPIIDEPKNFINGKKLPRKKRK